MTPGSSSVSTECRVPALLHDRAFAIATRPRGGRGRNVAVAGRLMRWLAARPDVATCFACLERELGARATIIQAIAAGAASTLTNVEVHAARCSVCAATAPTVCYRA